MTLKEKKEVCSKALIGWMISERNNDDMTKHDAEIESLFSSMVLLKKFKTFGIDIILPDMLLLILHVCVENNPGQIQIVLKDLLNNIKDKKGPIKSGYVITTEDFVDCFMTEFPIIEIPHIYDKYLKLWDGQKKDKHQPWESDNLCDTPEWWKEVCE